MKIGVNLYFCIRPNKRAKGARRKAEENLTVENNRQPSSFRLEALRRNDWHHFELHYQVRMGETDDADERAGR